MPSFGAMSQRFVMKPKFTTRITEQSEAALGGGEQQTMNASSAHASPARQTGGLEPLELATGHINAERVLPGLDQSMSKTQDRAG